MYTVTLAKAAGSGLLNGNGIIPHIHPTPLAHIAVVEHNGQYHVLRVNAGQVIEDRAASVWRDWMLGFASGLCRENGMPLWDCRLGSSDETAAEAYANLWTTQDGPLILNSLRSQREDRQRSAA